MGSHYEYLTEASPKTMKGEEVGYLTGILYLSPERSAGIASRVSVQNAEDINRLLQERAYFYAHNLPMAAEMVNQQLRELGVMNLCGNASAGCIFTCLNTAGRAGIMRKGEATNAILEARKRRTRAFFDNRTQFITALNRDIGKLVRRAEKQGFKPAVRLNGTSDLRFDVFARSLFESFPEVTFYDYTKDHVKLRHYVDGKTPKNYHLTFSYSETVAVSALQMALHSGVNVAVVYKGGDGDADLINAFSRITGVSPVDSQTINGDEHDLRFLDRQTGAIVALTAKGKAKRDISGFVIRA